jgi:ELWxxDGT repeat protein
MPVPFTRRRLRDVLTALAALLLLLPPARAAVEVPAIVKDVFAGSSGSITELGSAGVPPRPFTPVAIGGTFFFRANDGTSGAELWRSDGTEAGTVVAQDLAPGPFDAWPGNMTLAGSRLFFDATDPVLGRELWAGRAAILADRPDRAVHDLREDVLALDLPHAPEQSLSALLRAVEDALTRPRGSRSALRQLDAFRRAVEHNTPSPIPEAPSADLLEFVAEIEGLLEGNAVEPPTPFRRTLEERSVTLSEPRRY